MSCGCKKGLQNSSQMMGVTRYTLVIPGHPIIPENIPTSMKFDTLAGANAALRGYPGYVVATFRDV